MIHSIRITGYRGFGEFAMSGLGRVNLLVGRNNSGKTSVLEAISLLAAGNDLTPLWRILVRRGEQISPEPSSQRGPVFEAELSHLFTGHEAKVGSELSVSTTNQKPGRSFSFKIDEANAKQNPALFAHLASEEPLGSLMALKISGASPPFQLFPIPLTSRGTLRQDTFTQASTMARGQKVSPPAQYITAESIPANELFNLWNTIVLTPDEENCSGSEVS